MFGPETPNDAADVGRDHTHALGPGEEDLVPCHQRLELLAAAEHLLDGPPRLVEEALGQVGDVLLGGRPCPVSRLDPADAVEVGVEAPTGHRLDQVEDPLPVPKGEEERGGGTQARAGSWP